VILSGDISRPRVLLVSGTIGAGKSTVLDEIHTQLCAAEVAHACVDVDALRLSWPPHGRFNEAVAMENLGSVWRNFRAAGASRLVVAAVVERHEDVAALQRALDSGRPTICQLQASEATRLARIRARELGSALAWHLARTTELQAILDGAALADFVVSNDGRAVQEVAAEVLRRADWLPASQR
jgi:adenylylsulfate kinase